MVLTGWYQQQKRIMPVTTCVTLDTSVSLSFFQCETGIIPCLGSLQSALWDHLLQSYRFLESVVGSIVNSLPVCYSWHIPWACFLSHCGGLVLFPLLVCLAPKALLGSLPLVLLGTVQASPSTSPSWFKSPLTWVRHPLTWVNVPLTQYWTTLQTMPASWPQYHWGCLWCICSVPDSASSSLAWLWMIPKKSTILWLLLFLFHWGWPWGQKV